MSHSARPYLTGLLAALAFCWISIWNGYPLVYEDTLSYLERPATAAAATAGIDSEWANHAKLSRVGITVATASHAGPATPPAAKGYDSTFKSGRSIYYGIPAYLLSLVGGLWAVVAAQAVLLSIVLALLWYRCLGLTSNGGFAVLIGAMAVATSAGLFVNLVMPDLLGGLLILSLSMLLAFWGRLGRSDRIFLAAAATLAVVAHDSHLALGVAVVAGAALVARLIPARWREGISGPALGTGALVVVIGVVASVAFGVAVKSVTGQPPARLPHLTAHLVGKPVLAEFLATNCEGASPAWAVCAYRARLPLVWTSFLFESRPGIGTFATSGSHHKLAISEQDMPLMLAVLRARPAETIMMMLDDAALQLASFSYDDLAPREKANYIDHNFPPSVRSAVHASRLWQDSRPLSFLSVVEQVGVVVALPAFVLALYVLRRRGRADGRGVAVLGGLIIAGVVANAFICGGLASPYDRFQARVVWLIPLLAIIAIAALIFPAPATTTREP
ncbi:hypothetical protein KX816_04105 [Sphingosinicellaceae bacterium]|nr:hypothetical protein KX816_04105 [Sphingosinicellaceae bacterium]